MMLPRLSQWFLFITGIFMTGCVLEAFLPDYRHTEDWSLLSFHIEEEKGRLIIDGYPTSYIKGYEEGWRVGMLARPLICASHTNCMRTIANERAFPLFLCSSNRAHVFTEKKDFHFVADWIRSPSQPFPPTCMMNNNTAYEEGWIAGRSQRIKRDNFLEDLQFKMAIAQFQFEERLRQDTQYKLQLYQDRDRIIHMK